MRRFEWDDDKAKRNLRKHGVAFEKVSDFEFSTASESIDDSEDYLEERIVSVGFVGLRLYTLVYAERGARIRVISLRKASTREVDDYEKEYE